MPAWAINGRVRTPLLLIGIIEFLIAASALYVAGLIKFGSVAACERALGPLLVPAVLSGLVILTSLVAVGLYQFNLRAYFHETVTRILVGVTGGCVTLALVFLVWPNAPVSGSLSIIAILYAVALLVLARLVFSRTVDENLFRHRTLVFGAGLRATAISDLRRRADRRGFRIVCQVAAPGDSVGGDTPVHGNGGFSLTELAIQRRADEIVIAVDDRRGNLPVRDLLEARLQGISVIGITEFLERETGKIRIDILKPGWLVFSHGFRRNSLRKTAKRIVDVAASTLIIVLATPIILAIAAAIKIEEGLRAPLLYRQIRVGLGGRQFEVLKFRSMRVNAEADGKARYATRNDDRVTATGRFLRKYRADEIPQLFNILRGDMSLVGPRPERPCFVEELQEVIPYYSVRHTVKPGLTGWAQLRYTYGASEEDALEKLQYELYYIKNHSLLMDLLIILQTVEVVLWGKGAR